MEIISIFYSEFHVVAGAEILHQYPPSIVSKEDFKRFSNWVIPNSNLCGKLNVLKLDFETRIGQSEEEKSFTAEGDEDSSGTEEQFLISLPCKIEDPKYERCRFQFNFCFVVIGKANREVLSVVLKKLASGFIQMELESNYLSLKDSNGSSNKPKIEQLLQDLYSKLT